MHVNFKIEPRVASSVINISKKVSEDLFFITPLYCLRTFVLANWERGMVDLDRGQPLKGNDIWAGFTLKHALLYLEDTLNVNIHLSLSFFSLKTQWWKAAGKILLHAALYVSNLIWSCWRNIEEDVTGTFHHSSCQISDIEVTLKNMFTHLTIPTPLLSGSLK